MTLVVLDTGPLGLVTNPRAEGEAARCATWLVGTIGQGHTIGLPEIADYELRRELLRADLQRALTRLDQLKAQASVEYLPLTTDAMLEAARLWAEARNGGFQTADNTSLDGDVILAAQAILASRKGVDVVVATVNVGHLERYVPARNWQDIA